MSAPLVHAAGQFAGHRLEWAAAGRPMPGERVSGDGHVVHELPAGLFVAVIDGLGHGKRAAEATRAAVAVLGKPLAGDLGEPLAGDLAACLDRCHRGLTRTRGIALTMAHLDLDAGRLTWLGVGNIEAVLADLSPQAVRPRIRLAVPGGVVGYQIPRVRPREFPLPSRGVLAIATDGVDTEFMRDIDPRLDANGIAESVLAAHAKPSDDALVLAACWWASP